jgi:CheY-like chemotaxis protein
MKRIAVVEDNPVNALLVRTLLESRYDVDTYATGATALVGFSQRPPDLILLDIFLPDLDGPEVLQRLRADARWRDVPVIALTGNDKPGAREQFLSAGFTDYIAKSLTEFGVLLEMVGQHLPSEPS